MWLIGLEGCFFSRNPGKNRPKKGLGIAGAPGSPLVLGKTLTFTSAMPRSARRRPKVPLTAIECCEPRRLLVATSFPPEGVVQWGDLDGPEKVKAKLNSIDSKDYRFQVSAGEVIAFDLDPKKSDFDGTFQIFDDDQNELAQNIGGVAPRESAGDGYFEFTVPADGFYTVRISSPVGGKFILETTPLNRITNEGAAGGSQVLGEISLPNPGKHKKSTDISLERVTANPGPAPAIVGNQATWIVIHGRADSKESFRDLAKTIEEQTGDQVLLLDWSQGAGDNTKKGQQLDGAEWIPEVGIWLSEYLKQKGISSDQTYLVGHSWGSYVAYQSGADMGDVQGIIALDPARTGVGYDVGSINFASVSDLSWAFYGTGLFGSPELSATADESFTLDLTTSPDPFSRHSYVVDWFDTLIGQFVPAQMDWSNLFSLERFDAGMVSDQWAFDLYRDETSNPPSAMTFEGVFDVITPTLDDPSTWDITQLRYIDQMTNMEVTLTAPV